MSTSNIPVIILSNVQSQLQTIKNSKSSSKSKLKKLNKSKSISKSKLKTPINNKVTLATFNIFNQQNAIYNRQLNGNNIDLLFTQEDSIKSYLVNTKFIPVKQCMTGYRGGESVKVFQSTNIKDKLTYDCVNSIPTTSHGGASPRNAVIVDYKGIKFAGLHLEGGRYVDKELYNNFTNLLEYKLDLLQKVIDNDVDVIVGDFNSVYSVLKQDIPDTITTDISGFNQDLQNYLKGQYTYYSSIGFTNKKQINEWNLKPYKLLLDNGYEFLEMNVNPDNYPLTTNARGFSVIDTIWYKPGKVSPAYKATIISQFENNEDWNNFQFNNYSDHNPVIATFNIL